MAVGAMALIAATVIALDVVERRLDGWVGGVREVARSARQVQYQALTRNTLFRSYLLTEHPRFLRADSAARTVLQGGFDSLQARVRDAGQQRRLGRVETLLDEWDREMAAIVVERQGRTPDAVAARVAHVDSTVVIPLRDEFAEFLAIEDAQYRESVDRAHLVRTIATASLLVEVALVVLVLVTFRRRVGAQATALRSQNDELTAQATELEEQAVELEQQTEAAQALATDLEQTNTELRAALDAANEARSIAHEALRARAEALSQLEAALGSAPVGFVFYDRQLRYVRVNPAVAAISGISPEAHVGKRIGDVLPGIAPIIMPVLERVLATGAPILDVEVTGATPSRDKPRAFRASYYPIRDNGGPPIGVGGVILETTTQKELEAQLRQSQKMEAVGRLAGGIAHDFNNVLTAITSFSQLLLTDMPADAPWRADVSEIQAAADRASALTRQLLAFSRKQLLQPVSLDLNEVVTRLEEMLRRVLGEDIDLVSRLETDLDLAVADPGQIEQIVVNLAVNARDAMPGGGRLTIETGNAVVDADYAAHVGDLRPGSYVVLSVSDTGTGMDAVTQARIFEPFFTTKAPGQGTGLGLSTVYGIVKQSEGHIGVYSEVGKGTTFRIYLPRAHASTTRSVAPAADATAIPRGDETILLVEDDPAVRLVVARILGRQGYRVLEAPTPAAASSIVAAHPGAIDLVITDLVLPNMSGRELADVLTSVQPGVRVLFMSGYTDDAVIRRGLLEPGMPFLSKPFTVEELARRVRATLDGAGITARR